MTTTADVTIETSRVGLDRVVEYEQDSLIVRLTLRSSCDHPVLVRLADRFPGRINRETLEVDPDNAPRNWTITDDWLIIEDIAPVDGTCELVYGYKIPGSQQWPRLSTPMIDHTHLVDESTVESLADDAVPMLRGATVDLPEPPGDPETAGATDGDGGTAGTGRSGATDEDVRDSIRSISEPGDV